MIYSFSATGNSLHLAEAVAELTGDRTESIWRMPGDIVDVSGQGTVGFVFPVWFFDMPERLKEIISSRFRFGPDQQVWAVMDYGTTPGSAASRTVRFFSGLGVDLRFVLGFRMPENYTMMFSPPSEEETEELLSKVPEYAAEVAEEIALQDVLRPRFSLSGSLLSGIAHPFYGLIRRTSRFSSSGDCTGCGICAEGCPVSAISMDSGRPVWTVPKCLHCARCINICPQRAIEYGRRTRGRDRYVNPRTGPGRLVE